MEKDTREFSATELHILECGLGWITEAQDAFVPKLFHRLLRDHPEVSPYLQELGLQSFSRHLVQALETIISDLRSCGRVRTPLREQWTNLSTTTVNPLNPEQFIKITETYLDVFSELAEDAWSPTMESAWRKAIDEVSIQLWGQQTESFSLSKMLSPFQRIKRKNHGMSQPSGFFLGTLVVLAGGLASIGLWSRYRSAAVKLKRNPWLKKMWCS